MSTRAADLTALALVRAAMDRDHEGTRVLLGGIGEADCLPGDVIRRLAWICAAVMTEAGIPAAALAGMQRGAGEL